MGPVRNEMPGGIGRCGIRSANSLQGVAEEESAGGRCKQSQMLEMWFRNRLPRLFLVNSGNISRSSVHYLILAGWKKAFEYANAIMEVQRHVKTTGLRHVLYGRSVYCLLVRGVIQSVLGNAIIEWKESEFELTMTARAYPSCASRRFKNLTA